MKTFTNRGTHRCSFLPKKISIGCCLLTALTTITQAQPTVSAPSPLTPTICTGSNITFTVTASGAGPLTYQWQESEDGGASWNPLIDNTNYNGSTTTGLYTGVNSSSLTITRVPVSMDQFLYNVIVTDRNGSSFTSDISFMSVGPGVTIDDVPHIGCPTTPISLQVTPVSGLSYQWQVSTDNGSSWANVSDGADPSTAVYTGAATGTLTISNLPTSFNNNIYRYLANGLGCNVISGNNTLSVPTFATVVDPSNAVIDASNNAVFTVAASGGTPPITYRWSVSMNGGTTYTPLSDDATYSGTATNTLSITNVTALMFSYLYRPIVRNIGGCATSGIGFAKIVTNTTLPVELESLTAKMTTDASVQLAWTVGEQYHPQTYTIQRSANGYSFTDIGLVKGDSVNTSFSFTDDKPGAGTINYRLKMSDLDGNATYSRVINLTTDENKNSTRIELRPSITADGLTSLYTLMPRSESIVLTVMDVTGRQQWSQSARLEKGEYYTPLNVSSLRKGIYYVHVTSNDGIFKTIPFVKE